MLKAISLFTGVGGLDFGFEAAGFTTAVAIEMDRVSCQTIRNNRPWPLIEANIHDVSVRDILTVGCLEPGQADVLIGGPPCQPFSKSGYWARGDSARLDDSRADTIGAYLRVLKEAQPKALLLENVFGLAYKGKSEGLERILAGIAQVNRETGCQYAPVWKVIDAADYGVPQHRDRVFVVASRDGRPFKFPPFTHGDPNDLLSNGSVEPWRTAWDAIGDLSRIDNDRSLVMRGKWADLLPSIPEGENYLWHTPRGGGMPLFGWRTRYWNFLLKLAKGRPSWTIQAQPGPATGPFHWANRRLSGQELCRLQTFPNKLRFDCGINEIQRMVGNAVPSLVAEIIARAIREQLLLAPLKSAKLKLLPPRLGPSPSAEPVVPVPTCYHGLIGNHAQHPGTGRGNRARQRLAA